MAKPVPIPVDDSLIRDMPVESYWQRRGRAEREAKARAALRAIPVPLTKTQLERWADLKETIHRNHGSVVSMPTNMRMRFHCEGWNPLPDALRDCGHAVIPAGTAEVLWPVTDGAGIQTVQPCLVHCF